MEKVQYLVVTGQGNGEPAQDLVREAPKPLVFSQIPFIGEAGRECRGGTACNTLQNTGALLEKQKTEAARLPGLPMLVLPHISV